MGRLERWNLVCYTIGEGLWGFGAGLASQFTVLPLLIKRLGGGEEEIGLLSAIGAAGVLIPQVLSAFVFHGGRGKKRFLIVYHLAAIIPSWGAIGLAVLFLSREHAFATRVTLQLAFAAFTIAIGIILPIWLDWVAELFGRGIRGLAFGWSNAAVALAGTPAALFAAAIVDWCEFPTNYAILILLGAAIYVISMATFSGVREPTSTQERPSESRGAWASFALSMRHSVFRQYLIARLLLGLGSAPAMFFAVYFRNGPGGSVGENAVIALGALQTLVQAVSGLALGRLGDARGHRAGILIGAAAHVASIAIALAASGIPACALAFAFSGLASASMWVSHTNYVFESCPHDMRHTHIALTNLVLAPTVLVPWLAGRLAEAVGMDTVFAASLVPAVLGFVWFLLRVGEARRPA